jgi:type II secretory ATPase GspE/PulE/Tfp pilus assembly ATPase PilB-like protein
MITATIEKPLLPNMIDAQPRLDWPLPPYAILESEMPDPLCFAQLRDGKSVTGLLGSMNVEIGMLEIHHANQGSSSMGISFGNLKWIDLTQLVSLKSGATVVNEHNGIYAAPELRDIRIEFIDGEVLEGKTFGMLETGLGLYLYLEQTEGRYLRRFVPNEVIQHRATGEPLGKMLVDARAVSPQDIAEGLDQQQKLREKPLGEYLKSEEVLSGEQLDQVLQQLRKQPSLKLGEALLKAGIANEVQIEQALEQQKHNRKRALGDILIEMGVVDQATINMLLARKMGIPYIKLANFNIDPNVVKLIPEKIASKYTLMPLCVVDQRIFIAMENPLLNEALNEVRFHAKKTAEPVMASADEIQSAIRTHYGTAHFDDLASELAVALETRDEQQESNEPSENDTILTRLLNKTILDAHQQGASDIHIETYPGKKASVIRFRRDGHMVHYFDLPANFRNAIVSRVKIMANLDISEKRRAQDGKIDFSQFGPARIELRVATIPTVNGLEDVVLRILNAGKPLPLDNIRLSDYNLKHIKQIAQRPHGMLLVCGPTGSGKTTTLHSVMSYINTPERKIWTAEDPVEITQEGLRQVQTNTKIGWTFAAALRAFLRADPDVIMVGEMRDHETSQIGVEASLTGHLVLSTLHTNSATESVVRLLDLGLDPFNFSDALLGVLGQRLARALCPACKSAYTPDDAEIQSLLNEYCDSYTQVGFPVPDKNALLSAWKSQHAPGGKFTLYRATGCKECDNTGYRGRIGVHELLVNTPAIKALIQTRASVSAIQAAAFTNDMLTLKQDGIDKVLQGLTDIQMIRAAC